VKSIATFADARETALYGSKAVGLGDAARSGLPVPPGIALSGDFVEAVASGDREATGHVAEAVRALKAPFAVRSSAVDEDGANASFAGQHLTVLNVPDTTAVPGAVREVWWSANSDSAITYRQRVGLFTRPSVGVVVQTLLNPTTAGVMFTQNPVDGSDERLVEASWGLGEAVVSGRVIPDNFRIDRAGRVLGRRAGRKHVALRPSASGGTLEEQLSDLESRRLCLEDAHLAALSDLANRCEQVYGPGRDIEWAFEGDNLFLLQCRAITTVSSSGARKSPPATNDPAESLQKVQFFAGLDPEEVAQISGLLKERRFEQGETVIMEGTGGAAFFVIESGNATVTIGGALQAVLGPGDHFGEVALIDGGPRTATVTAASELVCHGLTFWEFRPLVEANGRIGWKLLEAVTKQLREARRGV
jgi:pyruvate,water dikinase